jgi:hypothetical protein
MKLTGLKHPLMGFCGDGNEPLSSIERILMLVVSCLLVNVYLDGTAYYPRTPESRIECFDHLQLLKEDPVLLS